MRTFNNKSVWDAENQEWVEIYYIDGQEVDVDTFAEQAEIEELATEDDCNVCNECANCVGCDEHCGRGNHDDEYTEDEEDGEMCFCPECQQEREQELITECLDMVFNPDACVNCTIDKVIETLYKFKELGYLEARDEIKEFLKD